MEKNGEEVTKQYEQVLKINDKQLKINPNVIDFLMSRLVRSYKSINLFIEKIDKFSLEKGKK